jgi:hypothetical protein
MALAALALLALETPRAQPGFQAPLSFETGQIPVFVAVGDFNGDGIPDLATANQGDNIVSILLGRGDGTFQPAVNYAAGTGPACVVVADFNRDGKLDLAMATSRWQPSSGAVSVLLGNGDGTFLGPVSYATGGENPQSLAVGDFNGDGVPDLAVANFGNTFAGTGASVSILLGNSEGSFQPAVNYPFVRTGSPNLGHLPGSISVVGADFNGDGVPDLAVATVKLRDDFSDDGQVGVLLGNGDGTFQAAITCDAGSALPIVLAAGDFNGDGKADLAVTIYGGNEVGVLLGNGDGTFQAVMSYPVGPNSDPWYVADGDLNGDGILDLAVSSRGSVSVLLGNGDGTFRASHGYPVGLSGNYFGSGNSVAIGDFNGDGKPDLAVGNNAGNNVSVLLGNGDGTFPVTPNYSTGSSSDYAGGVAVADFNGDGILDVAVINPGVFNPEGTGGPSPGTLSILLGKSDGTFQPAVNYPTGRSLAAGVAVADFNGDDILDLAVANSTDGTVGIFLGKGDGTFQPAVYHTAGEGASYLVVADFNGDGVLDLAVTNSYSGSVSVLLGKGGGRFEALHRFPLPEGADPVSIVVGDFNADGIPDLAVTSRWVSIFLGKGDGTFQAAGDYGDGAQSPSYMVVGDFNGDGKLDLAAAGSSVSVLLGNGDGSFQASDSYPIASLGGMAVGDVNGDGVPDLVAAFGGGVLVLLGNGDGTFQTSPISYLAGIAPATVAIGDFNGDGRPDVAVANASPNGGVSILINDGKWAP